jgi:hypothetical protein
VRAGAHQPELFVEREGPFAKRFHVSLHASGQSHLRVDRQVKAYWPRPDEIVPGYTREVGIVQPVVVAHHDGEASEGVVQVPVLASAQPTTFSVFIERPGADLSTWPGKNALSTTFVGRIPLAADQGTCCVVAHEEALQPGTLELWPRPTDDELVQMRELAARGTLGTTAVGTMSDGAIALIDLLADRNLLGAPELKPGNASDVAPNR